jgi:hypothetical protein
MIPSHILLFVDFTPLIFEEEVEDSKWKKRKKKAMDAKIKSIEKNDTLELINLSRS